MSTSLVASLISMNQYARLAKGALFLGVCIALCFAESRHARADVVVLSNRTPEAINVTVKPKGKPARLLTLGTLDSRPIFFERELRIGYGQEAASQEQSLESYCAYYFGLSPVDGLIKLEKIGLGGPMPPQAKRRQNHFDVGPEATTIPVKILVDDDESTHRRVWEPRLRQRIAKASQILEAHSGIRLKVVAVGTWDSDDQEQDFFRSLGELEREVRPHPARLAIGFSSQYRIQRGRVHLGGTRGTLHTHILLKERSPNVLETERVELLTHELGHFLGAAHSPEFNSVMRPVLSGGLQRSVDARVRFDPVNTLLVAMMGEEIRLRRVRKLSDVSLATKRRMRQIYTVLQKALPNDPAAEQYARLVGAATAGPLVEDTHKILRQIVRVAKLQQAASGHDARPNSDAGHSGDALTQLYVRQAALAAQQVKQEHASQAFIMALGVAMDDTHTLRNNPLMQKLIRRIETDSERRERLAVLGEPTMLGRRDLTKHFFVSALVVVVHGSKAARGAGMAKELLDAHGGSGFSFADMAANRAGILFAHAVSGSRLSLEDVAGKFTVEAFLPPIDDLSEGLSASKLRRDFGGAGDSRFEAELRRIEKRLLALPIYR